MAGLILSKRKAGNRLAALAGAGGTSRKPTALGLTPSVGNHRTACRFGQEPFGRKADGCGGQRGSREPPPTCWLPKAFEGRGCTESCPRGLCQGSLPQPRMVPSWSEDHGHHLPQGPLARWAQDGLCPSFPWHKWGRSRAGGPDSYLLTPSLFWHRGHLGRADQQPLPPSCWGPSLFQTNEGSGGVLEGGRMGLSSLGPHLPSRLPLFAHGYLGPRSGFSTWDPPERSCPACRRRPRQWRPRAGGPHGQHSGQLVQPKVGGGMGAAPTLWGPEEQRGSAGGGAGMLWRIRGRVGW